MKLLYIANTTFPSAGAQKNQIMHMCEAFRDNDVNVTLLAIRSDQYKSDRTLFDLYGISNRFKLHLVRSKYGNIHALRELRLFSEFMSIRKRYKIIYTRSLVSALLIKAFFPRKKVIYELHEILDRGIWRMLLNMAVKKLDKIIVISEGLRDELLEREYDKRKIKLFHDGVNISRFDIGISQKDARKRLKLPQDKKIVMYAGSLQEWKGVHTLMKSFKGIKAKNIMLCIVGGSWDDVDDLKGGAGKNIVFLGRKDPKDIPVCLKASDILVIPNTKKRAISARYTSPLKLFEFMAAKRPIIASNLESIRNIVGNKDVVFFKADDANDLSEKIRNLLKDKALQRKIVANSFKKVKDFDWKLRAKGILKGV